MVLSLWMSSGRTTPATISSRSSSKLDADLLLAFDHEIAVRQNLRHDGGDVGLQRASWRTATELHCLRTSSILLRRAACRAGQLPQGFLISLLPRKSVIPKSFRALAAALGVVGDIGLVGTMFTVTVRRSPMQRGALILEERQGPVPPQRGSRYTAPVPASGIGICTGL